MSGSSRPTRRRSDLLDERLPEEVEVLECQPGSQRDAVESVLGHVTGNARDLREQLVDVAQQRAATAT